MSIRIFCGPVGNLASVQGRLESFHTDCEGDLRSKKCRTGLTVSQARVVPRCDLRPTESKGHPAKLIPPAEGARELIIRFDVYRAVEVV
jgi:hypothetical protein